jgi:hypothetical protein
MLMTKNSDEVPPNTKPAADAWAHAQVRAETPSVGRSSLIL